MRNVCSCFFVIRLTKNELIKSGRHYSKSELAFEICKSNATVSRIIKCLIERNYIERVGSNKTGYWIVKENNVGS